MGTDGDRPRGDEDKALNLARAASAAGARHLVNGANLAPDQAVGRRTWEDFLAERVG
jgi:hypothetical protein